MKLLSYVLPILVLLVGCTVLTGCMSTHNPKPEASSPIETKVPEADSPETDVPVSDSPNKNQLENMVHDMSIGEKVGQMFLVRCPEKDQLDSIADYHLGGYLLFSRDFKGKTRQQLMETVESYQDLSDIHLFIAVDEEGGSVNRLSSNSAFREEPFLSPQELYKSGGFGQIIRDTREKSRLLKSLGINVNMAPVCDVSTNPEDFIYDRTFGKDAEETSEYVQDVVKTMAEEQIGSVLKHFPGYGDNADTHTGIAHDKRSYDTFADSDWKPFEAGIGAGANAVLVSHNIVEAIDSEYPASLSLKMHQILRDELDFDGVIMTDDLYMDAIKDYTGDDEAAVTAVLAGNDILCCTDFQQQIPAVVRAVEEGVIPEAQIDASVLRILKWKQAIGLIPR
ncbi:glycoside hydrolase family 3 protein [Diplocloster hominis]|uniref:glycoside hydrolase family 3 protein n=1 Tax=Diplocloster hominis TaxID=3079010 RepID=UPI0031BB0BCF